jgi:predicted aspartyl protease
MAHPGGTRWPFAAMLLLTLASCEGAAAPAPSRLVAHGTPGSASSPGSAAITPRTQAPVPVGPRRVALQFDLDGRKSPLPLVHGTVAGEPVWMVVDTGATSHVIASWLARKMRLPMHALGEVGSDHTGRAVAVYTVESPGVRIDGWGALAGGPMLVSDLPEPFEGIGIGVSLSPQWLGTAADAVVLDLPHHEMRTAPWAQAVMALQGAPGREIARRPARLCRDTASAIQGLEFVLPASIDGHAVDLLLDTGAERTDLLSPTRVGRIVAGRARPSEEPVYAAAGRVKTRLVQAAQVKIGDWSLTTDIDLVPGVSDPTCPRDGVVSMDALSTCTLLLGRQQLRGRCGP